MAAADKPSAATTEQPKSKPAENLYEALREFAEANRAMLSAKPHASGMITLLLTWNSDKPDYRASFGLR